MAKVGLASPWVIYYKEINELFKYDAEVHAVYDEDNTTIKLYVDNGEKAAALTTILPVEKEFGNIVLKIEVIPANIVMPKEFQGNVFEVAFKGNCILSYVKTISNIWYPTITFVVFANRVVQYYTDNLMDINGYTSTLYQNIAEDVFGNIDGVSFCTEVENNACMSMLGKPLGEWP